MFPTQMRAILKKEVETGAAIGPFSNLPFGEETYYSPLNSVPKRGSQDRRLILDLSYPPGNSINDSIAKDWYLGEYEKLTLPSIDALVRRIMKHGKGAKILKIDLKRAYRQALMCPGSIHFLCYVFEGKTYADTTLSMGSRSNARCCQRITSAVVHIFEQLTYFAINYLDDLGGCDDPD